MTPKAWVAKEKIDKLDFIKIKNFLCVEGHYQQSEKTTDGIRRNICIRSDQIRSVAQSCPALCDPMNRSTPGLPVHHQLPEFTQTHVHGVGDTIQPSHPLSSPSPPALNPSQHQSLFQWVKGFSKVNEAEVDRIFFGIPLLSLWSSECWQFDLWFLCLF